MARVVHFEIPSEDPERAAGFYRSLFGWRIEKADSGTPYWLVTTGAAPDPGIDGAIMGRDGPARAVVNTIGVEALEATLSRVKELGGEVVTEVMDISGVGRFAYCRDLDGHLFGVIEAPSA